MTDPEFAITIDGRDLILASEGDAFHAAEREFDAHGQALEISVKMGGRVYIGPEQMRHWWAMKRQGKYYGDIPY